MIENYKKSQEDSGEKIVQFCPYCGTKLDVGARFCKNCGETVTGNLQKDDFQMNNESKFIKENPSERKTVYEGMLHKCPNCGEVLNSFVSNCPACGHEFRNAVSSSSIKEFERRLHIIESRTMPQLKEESSLLKKILGRDLKDGDEKNNEIRKFNGQKRSEKISLILNYPIPNTKEDLLEFALLISSNIEQSKNESDDLTKAWVAKFDQVYEKAEIVLKGSDELVRIKQIYKKICNPIKVKRFAGIMGLPLLFSLLLCMGLFEGAYAMFFVSLVLLAAIIIISVAYLKKLYK